MFGARQSTLGSSEKEWDLHPKNEVEIWLDTKRADFDGFFGIFQPKCWRFAILAAHYNKEIYGEVLVHMSKND